MPERLPIGEHGLIGDLRTAALIDARGTVDWMCLPRFDSPSVFASLLDADAGHWTITPTCDLAGTHQFYLPDTNVLVTRFLTEQGVVEVQDFMPVRKREVGRCLIRRVECVRGEMELQTEICPRFDYGQVAAAVRSAQGSVQFSGADLSLELRADVALEASEHSAQATFSLSSQQVVTFALGFDEQPPAAHGELFEQTIDFWRDWLSGSDYTGRWREMVERSALTLKLLSHQPTGAIISAPTTSLPERIGGGRNWDYRYVWPRDAAFSAYALLALGFVDEARAFVGWLTARLRDAGDGDAGPLRPIYDLDGNSELNERELTHLSGYRGSSPVRIGNDASGQLQLDVYGEVIDSVYLYNKRGAPISSDVWDDVSAVADWLSDNWDRKDDGIWETRRGPMEHTFSRLMSWVAIERTMRIATRRGLPADLVRWGGARDAIYREIMDRGYSKRREAFVGFLDGDTLDASLLLMPMVKFISPIDPRFLSTLAAIEQQLVSDTLVFRYDPELAPDGIDGSEGTFSICSFWYVRRSPESAG